MVNISIDVTDLGGEAHPGDKVIFWRPRVGGSATHAGRVISTAPHTVLLEDGTATVPDVEPGEMRVLLQCRGFESQEPIPVVVPDGTGVVTLRALVESQFEYSPPIVSAVQQAADNAAASERNSKTSEIRSKQHADRAERIVDDAIANGAELVRDEVKQDADRAVGAKNDAQAAQAAAELARDDAQVAASSTVTDIHDELDGLVAAADGHASRAEQAAGTAASGAVAQVRSELDGLVEDASQSKTAAATSETNSAQSEADASGYAELAEQYKNAAGVHESNAAQSEINAAQSETNAAASEQAADAHRSMASQSESNAATHAQNASDAADRVGSAEQIGTWVQQAQDAADRVGTAEQVGVWASEASGAASSATNAAKGSAAYMGQSLAASQMAVDSANAAKTSEDRAKSWAELAEAAAQDSEHTHTPDQIEGLDAALARLDNIRAWFRGAGPPLSSIPGARVGDWWLDTSTMELHEITEV